MNKDTIDRILQILDMLQELDSIEDGHNAVKELCIICNSENLWDEIKEYIDEAMQGNEDALNYMLKLLQQVLNNMYSEISDDLKHNFFFEVIDRGVDEWIFNKEQREQAEEIYKDRIKGIISLPEEERIIASKKLKNRKARDAIIQSLSDEKKIEIIKEFNRDDEKIGIILLINIPNKKIEALEELKEESYKVVVIKTIKNDSIKVSALDKLQEESSKRDVIISIQDDDIKISVLAKLEEERAKRDVIISIKDVRKKMRALGDLKYMLFKEDIISTLENDDERIKAIDELQGENLKKEVIISIQDDDKKIEALNKLQDEGSKRDVIISIQDNDKKIEALNKLQDEGSKRDVIISIQDDDKKIEALNKLQDEGSKRDVIISIQDDDKKINALDKLQSVEDRASVIMTIKNDKKKLRELNKFEGQLWYEIAKTLSDETKIKLLDKCDENVKLKLIRTIENQEMVWGGLDKLEGEYKEVLKRLYLKNNEVVRMIDVRILSQFYLKTLGEDKINQISCYSDIQNAILGLSEKEYNIFVRCLNTFLYRFKTDEWITTVYSFLVNLRTGEYATLIENIEDIEKIDIEKLSKILQLKNYFNIETAEDIENFEEIKRKKCDAIINGISNIQKKKNAILLKLFGIDREYAEMILKNYGEDINSIEDGDEKNFVIAI